MKKTEKHWTRMIVWFGIITLGFVAGIGNLIAPKALLDIEKVIWQPLGALAAMAYAHGAVVIDRKKKKDEAIVAGSYLVTTTIILYLGTTLTWGATITDHPFIPSDSVFKNIDYMIPSTFFLMLASILGIAGIITLASITSDRIAKRPLPF
jgi:hypothetical protein